MGSGNPQAREVRTSTERAARTCPHDNLNRWLTLGELGYEEELRNSKAVQGVEFGGVVHGSDQNALICQLSLEIHESVVLKWPVVEFDNAHQSVMRRYLSKSKYI